jgi:GNAT superfamily N-acetyltransferase
MTAVSLSSEALTSSNLDEVVAFFRRSNPFAQDNWGWDTGRFIDWRWGSNTLREAASPGWFSAHCRIFRDGAAIRVVAIAEYGREDVCIITGTEDSASVRHVLAWLTNHRAGRGISLRLEISDTAEWLRTVFRESGLEEEANTGHEWEYELHAVSERSQLPDDFTIESLIDDQERDYDGIAECIQKAFNTDHDLQSALRSLESNPMFRPELSVFARSPHGRIAAYCRGTVDADNGVCGIDPVCCHPDFQRMGLSKAIVQTCFRRQRELGGRLCYIGSAPEPSPATYLYRSLGPTNRTTYCVWALEPDRVPSPSNSPIDL